MLPLKSEYIECLCHSLDHLVRFGADIEEREFWVDFTACKYPGEDISMWYLPTDSKWTTRRKKVTFYVQRFFNYLKNIKWAIFGRPIWYTANGMWGEKEAQQIIDFLTRNLQAMKCQGDNEHPGGCPCHYTTPCGPNCTCADHYLSGGCQRCAQYGSLEQRQAAAKRLAEIIDKGLPQIYGMPK